MIKEIKLKPTIILHNYVKVAVMDSKEGNDRERCQVTVEYSESDVAEQKALGKNLDGCMKYYEKWLYDVVKVNLATDWTCISGYEDIMNIIREHVKAYY